MIKSKPKEQQTATENGIVRPVASAEQSLGHNASAKRRLWERLNPRHRKQLHLLARALVLRQAQAGLPEAVRRRLLEALDELERLAARIEQVLAAMAAGTPLR